MEKATNDETEPVNEVKDTSLIGYQIEADKEEVLGNDRLTKITVR